MAVSALAEWLGVRLSGDMMHPAAGCVTAEERPGLSAEKLVVEADQAMYARKAEYYHRTGNDRRRQY